MSYQTEPARIRMTRVLTISGKEKYTNQATLVFSGFERRSR